MSAPRPMRPTPFGIAALCWLVAALTVIAVGGVLHAEEPAPEPAAQPVEEAPAGGGEGGGEPAAAPAAFPAPLAFQAAIDLTRLRLLAVQNEGRYKPLDTFARERVRAITGHERVDGEDPVFTLLSMLFEARAWRSREAIRLDQALAARAVTTDPTARIATVSLERIAASRELAMRFRDATRREREGELLDADDATVSDALGRVALFDQLPVAIALIRAPEVPGAFGMDGRPGKAGVDDDGDGTVDAATRTEKDENGEKVEIVSPDYDECFSRGGDDGWATPALAAPTGERFDEIAGLGDAMAAAFVARDAEAFNRYAEAFVARIENLEAPGYYPPLGDRRLELGYNEFRPARKAAALHFLAFLILLGAVMSGRGGLRWAGVVVFTVALGLQLYALCVRAYLQGYAPVASLYEATAFGLTMMVTIGLIFELVYRNGRFALPASLLAAAIASISELFPMGKDIGTLQAVLRSYWLNLHVTCMLTAYGALTLAFGVAVGDLIMRARRAEPGKLLAMEQLNYRVVQVGVLFLTAGVGLGAVWANQSWGRYWDWDPKETWAFITWMTYILFLHCRFMGWARGVFTPLWNVFGFCAIVFTYVGVSFLLQGEHSYLGEHQNDLTAWVWVGAAFYIGGVASLLLLGRRAATRRKGGGAPADPAP